GVIKYLYCNVIANFPKTKFKEICFQWQSFNIGSLNVGPVHPITMTQFFNSLVGKELRAVVQATPFVLFPYMTEEKCHLWTLLGKMCSYVSQTEILNKDHYL
ncbi:hypothetical protein CROQUDRAFT_39339, partial [Cronartium quercuum f. sp. fusiforme G11]